MKRRLNMIVVALLIVIGVLVWTLMKDRKSATSLAAVGASDKPWGTGRFNSSSVAAAQAAALPAGSGVSAAPGEPASALRDSLPVNSRYTAQPGDTVSNLAAELPGGDKKINRDAVINANPSLQRDPDLVITGKTYQIPADASVPPVAAPAAANSAVAAPAPVNEAAGGELVHELKYVARAGDTVSTLAAALLGNDSKENRDTIISANASLRTNPDRLITGQTYRIPVRESQPLSAAPAIAVMAAARPATQPDADSVVIAGSPRELRYTAKPGDNVTSLAIALLGSDTQENRDAVINNNASLKQNPDHVVAGQSYSISAPVAAQP